MLQSRLSQMVRFALLTAVVAGSLIRPTMADEKDKKGELRFGQPFVRIWYPATLVFDQIGFMQRVSEEAGIGNKQMFGQLDERFNEVKIGLENKRAGVLLFLVKKKAENAFQALLPAANLPELKAIRFMTIPKEEFAERVRKETQFYGGGGEFGDLTGEDDKFTFVLDWNKNRPVVQDQDGNQVNIPVMKHFFRYANGVMYMSEFEELFEMKLPSSREVKLETKNDEWDIYVEADARAVDKQTRGMAWQVVRIATQTALQQYDNEDDTSYFARRSQGEFQLGLLQSLMLDTDKVRFGLKYATDEDPIRLKLEVDARKGSDLAKRFGKLSRGDKRLASLRDRPAALTFATSWAIPDAAKTMVDGFFKLGRAQMEELLGTNFEALLAVDDLFKQFAKSLEDGSGDMVVKLARTEREFAIFGGMKLADVQQTGRSLELLLRALPEIDGSGVQSTIDKEGRRYLSFLTEDIPFRVVKDKIDKVPGRLHFCVADETLWFSLGGTESLDALKEIIQTASEAVGKPRRESVQFLIDLSLDRWLSDQNTPDGFSRLPHNALVGLEKLIHRWHVGTIRQAQAQAVSATAEVGDKQDSEVGKKKQQEVQKIVVRRFDRNLKFQESYLDKLLTEKQSGFRIELNASSERIRLESKIGLGLTKIFIARIMAVQFAGFAEMQQEAEADLKALEERPKK